MVPLTFNDGHLSQYTNVRPVLQAHNMNATFYVASGWADKNASGYVQWWQADDLYRDGNEIGAIGTDHKDLTQVYNSDWTQDYTYKEQQVCNDRQRLATRRYDPQSVAYLAGAYQHTFPDGSTVQSIVKGCGYLAARAVCSLPSLTSVVTAAATHGGGWLQFTLHHQVCSESRSDYNSCMSAYGSIKDTTLNAFLDWLPDNAPSGTLVRTVRQVMSGG